MLTSAYIVRAGDGNRTRMTSLEGWDSAIELHPRDVPKLAAGGDGPDRGWENADVVTHEDVRSLALSLPGASEQASHGNRPSWRTKPRMFAWIRDDPEALVVWVESEEDKHALIGAEPDKFFTTAHYDGYPMVLVRLEAIDTAEAEELVTESWRLRAPVTLVKKWDAERA